MPFHTELGSRRGPALPVRTGSALVAGVPDELVLEGAPIMLAFLIGTSILNIFLGYALAVYLMRESLTVENHRLASQLNSNGAAGGRHREQSDLYSSDGETP